MVNQESKREKEKLLSLVLRSNYCCNKVDPKILLAIP